MGLFFDSYDNDGEVRGSFENIEDRSTPKSIYYALSDRIGAIRGQPTYSAIQAVRNDLLRCLLSLLSVSMSMPQHIVHSRLCLCMESGNLLHSLCGIWMFFSGQSESLIENCSIYVEARSLVFHTRAC